MQISTAWLSSIRAFDSPPWICNRGRLAAILITLLWFGSTRTAHASPLHQGFPQPTVPSTPVSLRLSDGEVTLEISRIDFWPNRTVFVGTATGSGCIYRDNFALEVGDTRYPAESRNAEVRQAYGVYSPGRGLLRQCFTEDAHYLIALSFVVPLSPEETSLWFKQQEAILPQSLLALEQESTPPQPVSTSPPAPTATPTSPPAATATTMPTTTPLPTETVEEAQSLIPTATETPATGQAPSSTPTTSATEEVEDALPTPQATTTAPVTPAAAEEVTSSPLLVYTVKQTFIYARPDSTSAIMASVQPGEFLYVIAQNQDRSWFQLSDGQWIAASAVNDFSVRLPVLDPTQSLAESPPPADAPTPTPESETREVPPTPTPPLVASSPDRPGPTGKIVPNLAPIAQPSPWFIGGTLHEATWRDWRYADYENKLATAADWVVRTYRPFPDHVDKLLVEATEMVACLDGVVAPAIETYGEDSTVTNFVLVCAIVLQQTPN